MARLTPPPSPNPLPRGEWALPPPASTARRCYARRDVPEERTTSRPARARASRSRPPSRSAPRKHDREGSFPFENFEELRRSGYTAASVPAEYGGGGHGLDDVALAHLALAKGDGSTAIGLAMHLMLCGGEGQARAWPEAARARIFDAVVRDGALINNAAAEPELGSPQGGGRPRTTVTPEGPGRWRLSGHKTFTTLAPALTWFVTYVAVEDGSGDTGRVAVHRDLPGVRVEETWDALGMRASGSHDVHFDGVVVSDDDFLSRSGGGARREAGAERLVPDLRRRDEPRHRRGRARPRRALRARAPAARRGGPDREPSPTSASRSAASTRP